MFYLFAQYKNLHSQQNTTIQKPNQIYGESVCEKPKQKANETNIVMRN